MTSHQIADKLSESIRRERDSTNETLLLISMAMETRAYLDLGYPSMFDWLVRGFKYSGSSAYRRINAAKVLRAVPQLPRKLSEGKVNLTTVSKAEAIVRAHEKATGTKISKRELGKVIEHIEDKSVQDAERTLYALFPEAVGAINQDRKVVISKDLTRHHLTFDRETTANLERAKEVLSNKFPGATDAEVIAYSLKFLLEGLDPLRKRSEAPSSTQSVSTVVTECAKPSRATIRKKVIEAAEASCQFQDPITGKVCGSKHQLEIDHIIPKAMGGTDDPENLRVLCKQHNLHAAEKIFGRRLIDKFRRR